MSAAAFMAQSFHRHEPAATADRLATANAPALAHTGPHVSRFVSFIWRCQCDSMNPGLGEIEDGRVLGYFEKCWHCGTETTGAEELDIETQIAGVLEDRAADEADNA